MPRPAVAEKKRKLAQSLLSSFLTFLSSRPRPAPSHPLPPSLLLLLLLPYSPSFPVGYRVYLGNGQYFVSSDVGSGKMQWYAFHREEAGGGDEPGRMKERLLKLFGHWSHMGASFLVLRRAGGCSGFPHGRRAAAA